MFRAPGRERRQACGIRKRGIGEVSSDVFQSDSRNRLSEQVEVQKIRPMCQTDHEQSDRTRQLEPPKRRIARCAEAARSFSIQTSSPLSVEDCPTSAPMRRCSSPEERKKRKAAPLARPQHFRTSIHGARFGHEHDPDLRSLIDGVSEREQSRRCEITFRLAPKRWPIGEPKNDWMFPSR